MPAYKTNIFYPPNPSPWQRFTRNPILFIATWLYNHQPQIIRESITSPIKVVCISDTHTLRPDLPNGDILIHAGDLTINGTFAEIQAQLTWLNTLPHAQKVVVAGNHDILLDPTYFSRNSNLASPESSEERLEKLDWGTITYLQHTSTTLDIRGRTVRVYGAPDTPKYGNWAFEHAREKDVWSGTVPEATGIVVTHGPAMGHLDSARSLHQGCEHLLRELWRVKPRLHVCGHIHEARGVERVGWGWVQWCYKELILGRVWWRVMPVMVVVWASMWMSWMVVGGRTARTTLVNAAVVGKDGLVEGQETIVVEI